MWITKLKEKSFQILFGMFIVSLPLFFSNSLVDQFISPRIVETLKTQQYLREDIKQGRYLVTDQVSFADNTIIQLDALEKLNANKLASSDEVAEISEKIAKIELALQESISQSVNSLAAANKEIAELNQVIQALTSRELKVTLFISDIDSDKGHVVLNLHNKAISQIIENDRRYTIENNSGDSLKLTSRVEPAPANNFDKKSAVGRLHREDYHELFSGTKSGTRIAMIKLD